MPDLTARFEDLDNDGDAGNVVANGAVNVFVETIDAHNGHSATMFLHLYDADVDDVTPGSSIPKVTFGIAAGAARVIVVDRTFAAGCVVCASDSYTGGGSAQTGVTAVVFY